MKYLLTFLEGIFTFISPCLLPMIPIYLSYFAGGTIRSRHRTTTNAISFILGFSLVFMMMGYAAGWLFGFLGAYRKILTRLCGLVIIYFGLCYTGLFPLSFFHKNTKTAINELNPLRSFVFGLVFSISWTPCLSAFLGTALMMVSTSSTQLEGLYMLAAYALGLGVPFLLSALLMDSIKLSWQENERMYQLIHRMSAGLLIGLGLLMSTGLFDIVMKGFLV